MNRYDKPDPQGRVSFRKSRVETNSQQLYSNARLISYDTTMMPNQSPLNRVSYLTNKDGPSDMKAYETPRGKGQAPNMNSNAYEQSQMDDTLSNIGDLDKSVGKVGLAMIKSEKESTYSENMSTQRRP